MRNFKRVLSLALAALMVIGGLVIAPVDAKAAQADHVVIHEVYGAGSDSNAYPSDYVVLYNPTSEDVSLEGWALRYKSATGDKFSSKIALTGTIEAGKYYLVQTSTKNACTYETGVEPNCISSSIAMAKAKGVIALLNTTAEPVGKDITADGFIDVVGFGEADTYEGTAAPAPSDTTCIIRKEAGVDSDDNGADFKTQAPDLTYLAGKLSAVDELEDLSGKTPAELYALASTASNNDVLGTATLTGEITSIDYAYNSTNGTITVTIAVGGDKTNTLQCYKLKDGTVTDCANLAKGDTITVKGEISVYNSKPQFASGSTLEAVTAGPNRVKADLSNKTAAELYTLASGASNNDVLGTATLTGEITSIDYAYNSTNGTITVTIAVGGDKTNTLQCYKLEDGTVTDCANLAKGDTITVKGNISVYNSKPQFASGSTLEAVTAGPNRVKADLSNKTAAELYTLASGASNNDVLGTATLTGEITSIDYAYNSTNGTITVTIAVGGDKTNTLQCYKLEDGTATDCANLTTGDTITVKGNISVYNSKPQFASGSTLEAVTAGPNRDPGNIDEASDIATYAMLVLFLGAALVAVSVIGKRKMA